VFLCSRYSLPGGAVGVENWPGEALANPVLDLYCLLNLYLWLLVELNPAAFMEGAEMHRVILY
jgi:hypothetical protein